LPWRDALFSFAGAYAARLALRFGHPKPEEVTLSWALEKEKKKLDGDAAAALQALRRVVGQNDSVFDSLEEAYTFLMLKLARLVEERWSEIEAVANELWERFWKSGTERVLLLYGEVVTLIEVARTPRERSTHA
jgi:hypothetical protein